MDKIVAAAFLGECPDKMEVAHTDGDMANNHYSKLEYTMRPGYIVGEEWRPVVGYEGWYEVSDFGQIRRIHKGHGASPGKVLILNPHPGGYSAIGLTRDGDTFTILVHQVVAAAFIGPCPAGEEVNHKDTKKRNNRASNLEYTTHGDNMLHAKENGLIRHGEESHLAKLTEGEVKRIKELLDRLTHKQLAIQFGVSRSAIGMIANGKVWKHMDPNYRHVPKWEVNRNTIISILKDSRCPLRSKQIDSEAAKRGVPLGQGLLYCHLDRMIRDPDFPVIKIRRGLYQYHEKSPTSPQTPATPEDAPGKS